MDTRLERTVAVEVLPDQLSSPEARQRFERDAKTISQLFHPQTARGAMRILWLRYDSVMES